jgi:hypothetical protein
VLSINNKLAIERDFEETASLSKGHRQPRRRNARVYAIQNSKNWKERKVLTSIADFVTLLCRLFVSIDGGSKNPAFDASCGEKNYVPLKK